MAVPGSLTPAEQARVNALKRKLGESVGDYTDSQLLILLELANNNPNIVARDVWDEYAASTATLIDMAEGSSRRSLSKLYDQALRMAARFGTLSGDDIDIGIGRTQTRKIMRPQS